MSVVIYPKLTPHILQYRISIIIYYSAVFT